MLLSTFVILLPACRPEGETKYEVDADGDGVRTDDDCDDSDAGVGAQAEWWADADGDGHGGGDPTTSCAPAGSAASGGDCDDADATVHPGAAELCDGIDQDCDGTVDEDLEPVTSYADADGDGYGDAATTGCDVPAGNVEAGEDCDDADPAVHPGAAETDCTDPTDYNCDGSTGYADEDGDGWAACLECDDTSAAVSPIATETCNDLDDDCDFEVDEAGAAGEGTWYADADADGWGDAASAVLGCDAPAGHVAATGDCDDADPARHPGADESDCADATDYNCDGSVAYADADADGFAACEECDDGDAAQHPGATEVCNGEDDDCDGTVDVEAVDALTWYADTDGDGYGDSSSTSAACDAPAGTVADATDCDDADGLVNPAATELCNTIDEDCDDEIDEAGATGETDWYTDADGDGFGDGAPTAACEADAGQVSVDGDCDDSRDTVYPGADEYCDGIDQDCDGTADDGALDASDWHLDDDGDGYGDAAVTSSACDAPADMLADDTDCDDDDPRTQPGAVEICDRVDNDCDGVDDEDCVDATLVAEPSGDPVVAADAPSACALLGELSSAADSHSSGNLDSYMDQLTGASSGLTASATEDAVPLDYSIRCGSDYSASPGNYSPTNAWPAALSGGSYGAGRFRGYLNIGEDDPLNVTLGLIGNDALSLSIEGDTIVTVNWSDGLWKKFRYVSFPRPGIYAFEVRWSTNLVCDIDPFELVWAEGFVAGYDDYDTMCAYSSCTYGNGTAIPEFSVIGTDHLVQATDGRDTTCAQCDSDADCTAAESCNTAGICE